MSKPASSRFESIKRSYAVRLLACAAVGLVAGVTIDTYIESFNDPVDNVRIGIVPLPLVHGLEVGGQLSAVRSLTFHSGEDRTFTFSPRHRDDGEDLAMVTSSQLSAFVLRSLNMAGRGLAAGVVLTEDGGQVDESLVFFDAGSKTVAGFSRSITLADSRQPIGAGLFASAQIGAQVDAQPIMTATGEGVRVFVDPAPVPQFDM